ncbi:MAG TPA: translational GTPase TypA [Frankiaceae bacterium]|nr:translational GTPase TypA [Frankiaceae bacterium]
MAIIAHVDHGKTTLVDAMLRQSGVFAAHEAVTDRVMDSMDQERERGITILAKNAAVRFTPDGGDEVKLNLVDTPGHADFGGEVERGLSMVDGVVLLVDASEGPLPQTRFVLRKALALHLPVILVINKVDRPDARIDEVVDETYQLVLDLDATEEQIDFPIVYCEARSGRASLTKPADGDSPDSPNLEPLFDVLRDTIPAPSYEEGAPLQAHVTNLDASPYLGRLALCRIHNGVLRKGQQVAWCRTDGTVQRVKVSELLMTEALERVPADEAGPGDIVAIAGIPEITIGETLTDPDNPRPLPVITIDEPSLSMTVGTNSSPLAGESGKKLTARLVKNRLDQELVGNVSIRVLPTERPDTWEVQGRGELQLAVLVEIMRREGFELTVGKPQVVTRVINGKVCEPMERLTIDAPSDYQGVLIQLLALRKGRLEQMVDHGTGWIRMEYIVPARGLIGFRTEFLTETRGTGLLHHVHERYEPWHGELRTRPTGSLVSDRRGMTTGFALANLQERGTMFVGPGTEVYEGMIVGENARSDDMDVNPTKEKKLTNMRSSTGDVLVPLIPHRQLSLEQALEFCREDECVEVTPATVRIRKVVLEAAERERMRGKRARARLEAQDA